MTRTVVVADAPAWSTVVATGEPVHDTVEVAGGAAGTPAPAAAAITADPAAVTAVQAPPADVVLASGGPPGPPGPEGPPGPAGPAGPPGTPGTGGTGAASYVHAQATPAATWTVAHGLGWPPAGITVVDSAGSVVEGEVVSVDGSLLVLHFSGAFSGTAYLS